MDSAGSVDVDPVGCKDNSKPTDCFRFFSVFFSPYAFLPMSFTISGMTTTTIAVVASMIVIHFFSLILSSPYMLGVEKINWNRRRPAFIRSASLFIARNVFSGFPAVFEKNSKKKRMGHRPHPAIMRIRSRLQTVILC